MERDDVFVTRQEIVDIYNRIEVPPTPEWAIRIDQIYDTDIGVAQGQYDKFVDFLAKRAIKGYVIIPATEWQELQEMRSK